MIPRSFEYFSPRTLDEAIALLQKLGPEAKLLSGGQSLIPMMKLRLVSPEYIVDINRIPGLDYVSENDGHLAIGVDDVYASCDRIRTSGGTITREPGPVKGGTTMIAFVQDPDGYKIELIQGRNV